MARRYYSSTAARTTLATGVDDTTTTLSVTAVSGWPTSFPYTLVLDQDTVNEELVEVSARSGTTLTVTRGVDGTSAVAHSAGAAVNHGVSARDFDEPNAFINGTGTVTETLLATGSVTEAKLGTGSVTSTKILDGTIMDGDINASAAIAQSKISNLTSDLASKVDYALPVNAQTGTTYTFVAADAEKLTTASNASPVTLTIPPASSVAWPDNTVLRVVNYGAGAVTVAGGSGVTVTNTSSTIAQYGAAVAIRTGSDAWTLVPFGGGDVPPATVSSPAATGQYTDTGVTYDYYTFTSSGTLTVDTAGFADVLVVGGGGGGGARIAGGGGAGGYLEVTDAYLPAGTLTVTVGAGGTGGSTQTGSERTESGYNGISSRLGNYYGVGGGGGGGGNYVTGGNPGGSGGGGNSSFTAGLGIGGAGTSGQGNAGGTSVAAADNAASGGGGASAAGGNATANTTAGAGGSGTASSITGSSVTRGGGGGGGSNGGTAGGAGSGGGGAGSNSGNATNGDANTGGGGGGGGFSGNPGGIGGNGGSGVVIVRVRT